MIHTITYGFMAVPLTQIGRASTCTTLSPSLTPIRTRDYLDTVYSDVATMRRNGDESYNNLKLRCPAFNADR